MADPYSIESLLYPGGCSKEGFLLPKQTLAAVIEWDRRTVASFGVTIYQVGCVLERMVWKLLQKERTVDGKFRILNREIVRMYQVCPFEPFDVSPCPYRQFRIAIEKTATKEVFQYETFVSHLMKEHNFCGGFGTHYRIDLEGAIRFFDIHPCVDYTPKIERYLEWVHHDKQFERDESEKYLRLQPLAIDQFTSGNCMALLFPLVLPSWFETKTDRPTLESVRMEFVEHELQTRPFSNRSVIEQNIQTIIDTARHRAYQYRKGILESGCSLVVVASNHWDLPPMGLSIIRFFDQLVLFQVSVLHLDFNEREFRVPGTIVRRVNVVSKYL